MALIPMVPNIIPVPFGYGAQRSLIPTLSPGASSPQASWTSGFPPITMINKQAGGKPPLGQDFNNILYELSSHAYFSQSGCVYPWVGADSASDFPGLNYLKGSHVLGSDGEEYIALQPSGPDVPNTDGNFVGPIDPVGETAAGYWKKMGAQGGDGVPAGSVMPFYNVRLGGTANRNPIFWGEREPNISWLICDGGSDGLTGSVPDLREKFVMGATKATDAGTTGGNVTHTHTISASATATTLTVDQIPYHGHNNYNRIIYTGSGGNGAVCNMREPQASASNGAIISNGGSNYHTHGLSATASSTNNLPPYYKLVYCVKLPIN